MNKGILEQFDDINVPADNDYWQEYTLVDSLNFIQNTLALHIQCGSKNQVLKDSYKMAKNAQNLTRPHTLIATFVLNADAKRNRDTCRILFRNRHNT